MSKPAAAEALRRENSSIKSYKRRDYGGKSDLVRTDPISGRVSSDISSIPGEFDSALV